MFTILFPFCLYFINFDTKNVLFLWLCCFSDCWWWNISRVKTRRRRPFTNGRRLHSQQVALSSYKLNKDPFVENVGIFPQVWPHHPQPQELEPLRPTNHPTNIGRCCWNRTSTLVSKNCSLDRESVRCYDGSRKNRMLQPDEYYWYWLSLGLRRKSFAIYWHWYSIDIGAAASLMIIIGRRWCQGW